MRRMGPTHTSLRSAVSIQRPGEDAGKLTRAANGRIKWRRIETSQNAQSQRRPSVCTDCVPRHATKRRAWRRNIDSTHRMDTASATAVGPKSESPSARASASTEVVVGSIKLLQERIHHVFTSTCNRGLRQRLEHLFCDSPFECMLACVRPHRVRLVLSHSHHAPHPPYSTVGHAVGTMGVIVPSGRALLRKPPRPSWCELWWSYPMPTTS